MSISCSSLPILVLLLFFVAVDPAEAADFNEPVSESGINAGSPRDLDDRKSESEEEQQGERPESDEIDHFRLLLSDFRKLAKTDTLVLMGIAGASSYLLSRTESPPGELAATDGSEFFGYADYFHGGATPAALGLGLLATGYLVNNQKHLLVGSALLRSQIIVAVLAQGMKHAFRRQRPDGSDYRSFPSGHTMSTFAMASVLEREYGIGIGIAGYALASYISVARVDEHKHYWSDLVFGAVAGYVIGRNCSASNDEVRGISLNLLPAAGGMAAQISIVF